MLKNKVQRDDIKTRSKSQTPAGDKHMDRADESLDGSGNATKKQNRKRNEKAMSSSVEAACQQAIVPKKPKQSKHSSGLKNKKGSDEQTECAEADREDASELFEHIADEENSNDSPANSPNKNRGSENEMRPENEEEGEGLLNDSDKENDQQSQGETLAKVVGSSMKAIQDGVTANYNICDAIDQQLSSMHGNSYADVFQSLTTIMHRQTDWMRKNTKALDIMRTEILQPCVQFLEDCGNRKRRRSAIKPVNSAWKHGNIIIQMADKTQHELNGLDRQQVMDLVLLYQNTKQWPEPKIGGIGLKNVIQSELNCYFALIDEPRKLGYVVSQFLHDQEFYTQHFIPKYNQQGTGSSKEAEKGRTTVSDAEKKLFADIIRYIGGNLIAPYPVVDRKKFGVKAILDNKQLDFLNSARDAVNQQGQLQRAGAKPLKTNFLAHVDDFVPLLDRDNFSELLQSQTEDEEFSISQQSGPRSVFDQQSPTPRPTNSQQLNSPTSPRLSALHASPLANNLGTPSSTNAKIRQTNKASIEDSYTATQAAFRAAMKSGAKQK